MLSLEGTDLEGVRWCLIQALMDCWDVALRSPPAPAQGTLREACPGCKVLCVVSVLPHIAQVPGSCGQGGADQAPAPLPVSRTM